MWSCDRQSIFAGNIVTERDRAELTAREMSFRSLITEPVADTSYSARYHTRTPIQITSANAYYMVQVSEIQAGVQLVSFKSAKGSVNVLGIGLRSAQRVEKQFKPLQNHKTKHSDDG